MKKTLLFGALAVSFYGFGMEEKKEKQYTKQDIIDLVASGQIDSNDPISTTLLLEYQEDSYKMVGSLVKLTDAQRKIIESGNFVHALEVDCRVTHLSETISKKDFDLIGSLVGEKTQKTYESAKVKETVGGIVLESCDESHKENLKKSYNNSNNFWIDAGSAYLDMYEKTDEGRQLEIRLDAEKQEKNRIKNIVKNLEEFKKRWNYGLPKNRGY